LDWIAPLAALVYIGVSLLIGDWFPFSRYSMYASIGRRDHGATPYFKAAGEFVRIDLYGEFLGLELSGMYPQGTPCSLEWQVHEARRWIKQHPAPDGPLPSPEARVPVEFGFRLLWVDDAGHLTEKLRPTLQGTARRLRRW
jgi:hypothetical protein